MMRIDCIHIGLHKTGSTWLQVYGFINHPEINLLNKPNSIADRILVNEFIEINDFDYNANNFLAKFEKAINFDCNKVNIISEENLSGKIYSGINSKILADRLLNTFGKIKILIVIRKQEDYIVSAYSNYLLHGGALTLKNFLEYTEIPVLLTKSKLQYHKIISYYLKLFGEYNVKVLLYEQFKQSNQFFLDQVSNFLKINTCKVQSTKKVNISFSAKAQSIVRLSNGILGGSNRYVNYVARSISRVLTSKIKIYKYLDKSILDLFAKSNRILQGLIDIDLKQYNYLL